MFLVLSCADVKPKLILRFISYIARVFWEMIFGLIHCITCLAGALSKYPEQQSIA